MESKQIDNAGITLGLGALTLTGLTGGATTYSSAVTPYAINGRAGIFAVQSGVAFPTTDLNTGLQLTGLTLANTAAVFVVGVQFGGTTLKCIQGPIVGLDSSGKAISALVFPSLPDNFVSLAYFVAKAGATFVAAAWYPGTTNWNTTGMTYVADVAGVATAGSVGTSCVTLPDRPVIN